MPCSSSKARLAAVAGGLLILGAIPFPLASQSAVFQEEEGFVGVEGGRLYYREAGEGPPVILMHGGYLDHRMWDGQVRAFAQRHRTIRYDIRSHGQSAAEAVPFSDAKDLAALMDSLDISRAHLVGLSMGGYIAADFALTWPGRVESLVLVGPGISGAPVDSPELRRYVEELGAAVQTGDFEEMIQVFTRYWCDGPRRTPEEVDPGVRSRVLEMLEGSLERWEHSRLEEPLDPPAWGRVSHIRAPTLVILGTVDMPDIHFVVSHLVQEMPNVRQVDIPGVAHMVNMEAPERFNEVVLDFLRGG